MKAGDLALIIRCDAIPEFVGKCVELIKYVRAGDGEVFLGNRFIPGKNAWFVKGDVYQKLVNGETMQGYVLINETRLMPLKGYCVPEFTKEEEMILV